MLPWPRDALYLVANIYLEDLQYPNINVQLKESLTNMFVRTQESLDAANQKFKKDTSRNVYITAKSKLNKKTISIL